MAGKQITGKTVVARTVAGREVAFSPNDGEPPLTNARYLPTLTGRSPHQRQEAKAQSRQGSTRIRPQVQLWQSSWRLGILAFKIDARNRSAGEQIDSPCMINPPRRCASFFDGFTGAVEIVLQLGGRTSYVDDGVARRVA
jgi:hypothetical protein